MAWDCPAWPSRSTTKVDLSEITASHTVTKTTKRRCSMVNMKTVLSALAGATLLCATGPVLATGNADGAVKIGVLGDMSGLYADGFSGPGAVAAVKMAVKDFGGEVLGKPIEVVFADHQNKADIASSIARKWIDEKGVDMITDGTNSATGLAVQHLASDK